MGEMGGMGRMGKVGIADINARPPNEGNAVGLTLHTRWLLWGRMDGMGRMGKVGMADINTRTPNEGEEEKKWRYFQSLIP